MERKYIALGLLMVCTLSLLIGLLRPKAPTVNINIPNENSLLKNIEITGDRIALLNIEGAISSDLALNSWQNTFTTDSFLNSLIKAEKDPKVKAIIIRINSPGGTVAASQDIYDAILRARKIKPVVASMADVAASGGYYAASAADRIVAQKGTMTGSIGVIFNFVDIAKLADKIGVSSNVIKSGKYKDSGSMYRKMDPAEKELFETSVNNAYQQFITAIETARVKRIDHYRAPKKELSIATLKKYADGRVFLGDEAFELGFVDKLGSQYDAQILASQMAGYNTILPIVSYTKMNGLGSILMSLEGKFFRPLQNIIPFSIKHNLRPLMILE